MHSLLQGKNIEILIYIMNTMFLWTVLPAPIILLPSNDGLVLNYSGRYWKGRHSCRVRLLTPVPVSD